MNDLKKPENGLKKDAAFVYSGYLLRYLTPVVLIPYYGRVLGPTGYGRVLAAMSLMNIVWLVVNYGFSITGTRELASARSTVERERIYGRFLFSRLILVPVGIMVGLVGALSSPILAADLRFGALATALGILSAFNLGWFFQGIRAFRTSMAIEAISYPLTVIIVIATVRAPNDGIRVLLALGVSGSVCLLVGYLKAGRVCRLVVPTRAECVETIKGAGIIFLQSVSSIVMTSGMTYLVTLSSTPEEVGYFGSAERFVALGLGFLGPAAQILSPTISNILDSDFQSATRLARKGVAMEVGYGIVTTLCGVFLSPALIPFVLGKNFVGTVQIFQIMVLALPFASFTHAAGLYLFVPLRWEKLLILAIGIGSLVNLVLAVAAGQMGGALGIAFSRVAGEAVSAVVLAVILVRRGIVRPR